MQTYTTLRTGTVSPEVGTLQRALNNLGYTLTVDNVYGPATADSVRKYQASVGLVSDGVAGQKTLTVLYGAVSSSTTSHTPLENREQGVPFSGPGLLMSDADINEAAALINVKPAHIKAICAVEVGPQGAFDNLNRPTILFERHYFHRLTKGAFSTAHPDISYAKPGGYGKFSEQYTKLLRAVALDRAAALSSASWGMFQVMGANWRMCEFKDIEDFVWSMAQSEKMHLRACVNFIKARGLVIPLREGNWPVFSDGYNGPNFAINQYDIKLRTASLWFDRNPTADWRNYGK